MITSRERGGFAGLQRELDGDPDLRGSPEGVPEGVLDGELDPRGSPEGVPEGVEGTRAVVRDRERALRALRMVRARRLAIALGASGQGARSR